MRILALAYFKMYNRMILGVNMENCGKGREDSIIWKVRMYWDI